MNKLNEIAAIGASVSREAFGKYSGALDSLTAIAYLLVGLAIMGGVGVLVVAQFNASTTNTNAQAFLAQVMSAYTTLGSLLGVVVIALIGFSIINFIGGAKPQ